MRKVMGFLCTLAVAGVLAAGDSGAQTTLQAGDVAFSGYTSSGTDQFSFVLLRDVTAGTTLAFTDRGWLGGGGFRSGEGAFELTFDGDYGCGAEFVAVMSPLSVVDAGGAPAGTLSGGGLQLSTSGDQVFAYQGALPSPGDEAGLLAGIQMNGGWDADATSTNTSALPATLVDGVHALALAPETNNAQYDCAVSEAEPAVLVAAYHDAANWQTDDATPFDLAVSCGATCAGGVDPNPPAPPTVAQQKCLGILLNQLPTVARLQGNEALKCAKAYAKGKIASAETCVADDATGKIAKARTKVGDLFAKKCVEMPDFGLVDDVALADAATGSSLGAFTDLLDVAFDGAILPGDQKAASKCQLAIVGSAKKCFDARLKEFAKCVKAGLKDGSIVSAAGIAACIGADPKGKIAKACDLGTVGDKKVDGLRKSLTKLCVAAEVTPSTVLPACPGAFDVETAHDCVTPRIACRACLAADEAGGLAAPCDELDDGTANGSCPA